MKVIRWMLFNGAIGSLLWVGLALEIHGARNVGLFAVWFVSIISLGTFSEDMRTRLAKDQRWPSVPGWMNGTFDLFIAGLLVWFGFWWSGAAWTFHMMSTLVLLEKVRELRAKSNVRVDRQPSAEE